MSSGVLGAAFGGDGVLIGIAVGDVDAGAGGDELFEVRLLFGMDEGDLVLKAQIDNGGVVEIFPKVLDLGGKEDIENTFTDGGDVGGACGVAVLKDNFPFVDGHHGGGGVGFEPGAEHFQACAGEAGGLGLNRFPGDAGNDVAVAHVDGGLREERRSDEKTGGEREESSAHAGV